MPSDSGYVFGGSNTIMDAVSLYWDRAAWVFGNGMGFREEDHIRLILELDSNARSLRRHGFLQMVERDVYHPAWDRSLPIGEGFMMGVPLGEFVSLTEERIDDFAIEMNESRPAESWSTARPLDGELVDGAGDATASALLLTIALPVPPAGTPVRRIRNFRRVHKTKIDALHDLIRDLADFRVGEEDRRVEQINSVLDDIGALLGRAFKMRCVRRTQIIIGAREPQSDPPSARVLGESAHGGAGLPSEPDVRLVRVNASVRMLLPGHSADYYYAFSRRQETRPY
jgi:hypothetical protein